MDDFTHHEWEMPTEDYDEAQDITQASEQGMTSTQIESVTTALTNTVNATLSTFIDLLPLFAVVVPVIVGIAIVKKYMNKPVKSGKRG